MEILSVKIQPNDGYVVRHPNGNISSIHPGANGYADIQEWIADGNKPEPEFTAVELKAKTAADKETTARAAFNKRLWDESPEKAALK